MPVPDTPPQTSGAVPIVANMPSVGNQEGEAMGIVIEPAIEWIDEPAPSASRSVIRPDTRSIPNQHSPPAGRGRRRPVGWLVAGGAIAIAVTAVVATPTNDIFGSRTNT